MKERKMFVEIILIVEWYRKLNINIYDYSFLSQVKSRMESLLIILAFEGVMEKNI